METIYFLIFCGAAVCIIFAGLSFAALLLGSWNTGSGTSTGVNSKANVMGKSDDFDDDLLWLSQENFRRMEEANRFSQQCMEEVNCFNQQCLEEANRFNQQCLDDITKQGLNSLSFDLNSCMEGLSHCGGFDGGFGGFGGFGMF